MTNRYGIVDYVPVVWAAVFLAACGEDASSQPGDTDAAMQARDAATGTAADVGSDGGVAGRRCDLPTGWPTLDSVLSMAEAMPDTGSVRNLVMTPLGLHWLGDGGRALYRLGTGGDPELVVMRDQVDGALQLVANSTGVAWFWSGSVWGMLLDAGATATELATEISLAGNPLLMDGSYVYYDVAFGDPGLTRVALTGGDPEKLPVTVPEVLAVHDGYAYYLKAELYNDILMRTPVDGGAHEQVADGVDLTVPQFVFDGNVIYIAGDSSLLYRTEIGVPSSSSVVHRLVAKSQSRGINAVQRLILDGDRLVFADWYGTVGWARTDGTGAIDVSPTQCANILADPDQGAGHLGPPVDIALDDQYLYLLVFIEGLANERNLYRIERAMVGL